MSEEWVQKFHTEDMELPRSSCVVLLIGCAAVEICFNRLKALPRSRHRCHQYRVFRLHFVGKLVMASQNVGCFLRLIGGSDNMLYKIIHTWLFTYLSFSTLNDIWEGKIVYLRNIWVFNTHSCPKMSIYRWKTWLQRSKCSDTLNNTHLNAKLLSIFCF